MSKAFQLSGRLPGQEQNGLEALTEEFLDVGAPEPVIAICRIERKSRTVDDGNGEARALARITHIEVAEGSLREELVEMLGRLAAARSGDTPLPEADFEAGFGRLDPMYEGV